MTRQNSSIAHEIGHIVLRHQPAKMYVTEDGHMIMSEYNFTHEEEATWFAGAILLPRDALLDVVGRGLTDCAAAEYYATSNYRGVGQSGEVRFRMEQTLSR